MFESVVCFWIGWVLICLLGCIVLFLGLEEVFFIIDCLVVVFVCFILFVVGIDREFDECECKCCVFLIIFVILSLCIVEYWRCFGMSDDYGEVCMMN